MDDEPIDLSSKKAHEWITDNFVSKPMYQAAGWFPGTCDEFCDLAKTIYEDMKKIAREAGM